MYNPGKKLVIQFLNVSPLPPYTMLLFMRCMLESDFILFNIVPGEGGGGGFTIQDHSLSFLVENVQF